MHTNIKMFLTELFIGLLKVIRLILFNQDENIIKLCNAIPKIVYHHGQENTSIHQQSIEICQKFKLLFSKYGACHRLLNSSESFDEDKIKKLGW